MGLENPAYKSYESIEQLKFEDVTEDLILKIDFKGIDDISEFTEMASNINSFTEETKKAVNLILGFKKAALVENNSIQELIQEMITWLKNSDDRERQFLGNHIDLLIKNKRLVEKTSTDPLTGLNNRAFGEEKLKELFNKYKRYGTRFSIISIDIDYFKKINDAFGHDIGDKTLKGIAELMQKNFRKTDFICRWGGEEFLIILDFADETGAYKKAELFRKEIEINLAGYIKDASSEDNHCSKLYCKNRPECHKTEKLCIKKKVTCSIGITTIKDDDTIEELIKRADTALYKAKDSGRNKVIYGNKINSGLPEKNENLKVLPNLFKKLLNTISAII